MKFNSKYLLEQLITIIIIVVVSVYTYNAGLNDGRIDQCNEKNKVMTDAGCISCESIGLIYVDGHCERKVNYGVDSPW